MFPSWGNLTPVHSMRKMRDMGYIFSERVEGPRRGGSGCRSTCRPATLAMAETLVPSLVLRGRQAKLSKELHRHLLSAWRHWEPTSFWRLSAPTSVLGDDPHGHVPPAAGRESELPLWSQLFMVTWHCLMHCNLASLSPCTK